MKDMPKLSRSARTLRSNIIYTKLDIPTITRQTFATRSFNVMGPRLWNDISNEVKECADIETYKEKLKTFLFNKF